jgi:hypothetical protein
MAKARAKPAPTLAVPPSHADDAARWQPAFVPCPQPGCHALLLARVWKDRPPPGHWEEKVPPVSAVTGDAHQCVPYT